MHHCMQSMPVYLFPELVVVMRRQKARVAEARLRSAHWEDHDLAFPTSIGTPCDPHNVRRVLKPLALSAGFPGAFKGLRALHKQCHFSGNLDGISSVKETSG